jgi:hypothetical protein
MTNLPNPFDSGVVASPPDKAAAPQSSHAPGAAADLSCIGEIFVGARKLEQLPGIFDPTAITGPDELLYVTLKLMDDPNERDLPEIPDEAALWDAIDPLPIFLQRTA